MIDYSALFAAALVCAAAIVSPGPNFVAITHRAVSASRAEALSLAFGVSVVSAGWAAAALFGLGILFAMWPWLFMTVKLAGAAYLIWLGLNLLRGGARTLPHGAAAGAPTSLAVAFRSGMLTNLANPKAMVFYGSVFSAFVPATADGASRATEVAMVVTVGTIAALWYGGLAWFLANPRAAAVYRRGRRWIEGSCGLLLLGLGLRQALASP